VLCVVRVYIEAYIYIYIYIYAPVCVHMAAGVCVAAAGECVPYRTAGMIGGSSFEGPRVHQPGSAQIVLIYLFNRSKHHPARSMVSSVTR
jgi:hypothetical protein